jgi:hypothetical protein
LVALERGPWDPPPEAVGRPLEPAAPYPGGREAARFSDDAPPAASGPREAVESIAPPPAQPAGQARPEEVERLASLVARLESLEARLSAPPAAPDAGPRPGIPTGLAESLARLALAGIEPPLEPDDWALILKVSRREVDRLRSAGRLPKADFYLGRSPRWCAATARDWMKAAK